MKTVRFEGKEWAWPEQDEKLLQVIDYVRDVAEIMQHVDGPSGSGVCVQAGGATGVWAVAFSRHFDRTLTFEPDHTNFACLARNIAHGKNISAYCAALGARDGFGRMAWHELEARNAGAGYIDHVRENAAVGSDPAASQVFDIHIAAIDTLRLSSCDLIQLDVEGFEEDALVGARNTIRLFQPVVVIEEKELPQARHKPAGARIFLENNGYVEVGRVHRDVIFKHRERA